MGSRAPSITATLTCAALLLWGCSAAEASKPTALVDTSFGVSVGGLRLAVVIDKAGSSARFYVRNVGTKPVRFVERYSCSGLGHLWLQSGTHRRRLSTTYSYQTKPKGLSSTPISTMCTRNGPIAYRTLKSGATTIITVPFVRRGAVAKSKDKVFQGYALLSLEGLKGQGHVRLATPIAHKR